MKFSMKTRFPDATQFFPQEKLSEGTAEVTVVGQWFPGLEERLRVGSADVWREPGQRLKASTETSLTGEFEDVVDPIALRTFYMLKTGADVMWDRLPVHFQTTFRRFPFHQTYSDEEARIGKEAVIDILAGLPQALLDDPQLTGYRIRRQNVEKNWGWDSRKVKVDSAHEGWESDKFKNIPMLLHAFRNAPKRCDWFVFADDDTFIMSHSLGSLLRDLNPKKPWYIGSPALIEGPFSNSGKVGTKLHNKKPDQDVQLWFAHGGSGIVVSRGALEALFWDPQREDDTVAAYSRRAIHECCGDAMVGYMLREELELFLNDGVDETEMHNDPFQGATLTDTLISVPSGGWCQRIVTWHHLTAVEINKLYEWETSLIARKPSLQRGILYSDVYHDFILPFLVPERADWNIFAASVPFNESESFTIQRTEEQIWPARSKQECIRLCEEITHCLGWTFGPGRCTLQDQLTRGIALNEHSTEWEKSEGPLISGWIVEKIRQVRSGEECDPLTYDQQKEEYNDSPAVAEGWYLRRLDEEKLTGSGFDPRFPKVVKMQSEVVAPPVETALA